MTKNTRLSYIIALISVSVLAVIFTAFRTFVLFDSYNTYFNSFGGTAHTILSVLMCFTVFSIVVYSLCALRTLRLTVTPHHALTPFSSIFAVVSLFIFLAVQLMEFSGSSTNRLLLLTALVMCVLSFPFFALSVFSPEPKDGKRSLSAISCVIFFMLLSIVRYISADFPTTSPTKNGELVCLILITLFMVYECRMALSREVWTLHIICGLSCAFTGTVYSVSTLLYLVNMVGKWRITNEFMVTCLLIFAFSVYAGIRMYSVLLFKSSIETPPESMSNYEDLPYAMKSEADGFTISAEKIHEQLPSSDDTECVSASVQDKIDEGSIDSVPSFCENPDE